MSLLSVQNVSVRLEDRDVLNGVSFAGSGGELVGVLGPNGAGKSTLMNAVAGALAIADGEILIDGVSATAMTAGARAKSVAYLPQQRLIHWPVSVETIVGLGRLPHRPFWKRASGDDDRVVRRSMHATDIEHLAGRAATKLSGGEQARVLLARVLAQEAAIVLADEPTTALDPAHQISVMNVFKSLSRQGGLVVVTLHDINLASRWCDRVIVMQEGAVVADGDPDGTISDDLMRDVYGVECQITNDGAGPIVVPTALVQSPGADA